MTYRRSAEIHEALLRAQPHDPDDAANLAVTWSNLAKTIGNVGRVQESDALLDRTRKHLEDLGQRLPGATRPRELLADVLHTIGDHAADRGEFAPARDLYQRSLALDEAIVREHPDDWGALVQLARINNELGLLHFHFKYPNEALRYYEKSRDLRERLLAAEPASAELQEYLSRSLDNLGNLHNSLGKYSEALPVLERVCELRGRMVAASPGNAEMQGSFGGALHNLAMSHEGLGHLADAERLYREAITHQERARAIQPGVVVHRVFLTNHLHNLGSVRLHQGHPDEAADLAKQAAGLWTTQAMPLVRSAQILAECVQSVGSDDSPDAKSRRERYGKSAVELLSRAVDGGFKNVEFFRSSNQLDPIRGRNDFKALLQRLESSSAPSQ